MPDLRTNGQTSNVIRLKLINATTGNGMTGLTISSSGLIISTICNNEATATVYTAAGSTIETIATLGTFAAPTSTKCRFKEVDSTNHPGLYEFQFADARFAVSSAKYLTVTVSGVTNLLQTDYQVEFNAPVNVKQINDATAATPGAAGGLLIAGSNAATTYATLTVTGATMLGPVTIAGAGDTALTITSNTTAVSIAGTTGITVSGSAGAGMVLSGTTADMNLVGTGTIKNSLTGKAVAVAGDAMSLTNGERTTLTAAIWDALTSGMTTVGSIGKWILDKIDATISSRLASASYTAPFVFTGANAVTITVQDSTPTLLSSAKVRITQGANSQLVQTNGSGVATFSLDDGTYTISITKGGYTFTPTTIDVDSTHTSFTKVMTANSVPVPSTGQCTGILRVLDAYGDPEVGATIYFQAFGTGASDGYALDSTIISETSNGDGTVYVLLPSGGMKYRWRRGTSGLWTDFTTATADAATFDIPSGVGKP